MKAEKTLLLLSYFGCVVSGIIRKSQKTPTELIEEMNECCIELEELQTKAATYDSKEVQDAIECDRIEKRLIELNKLVSITTNCIVGIGHSVIVGDYETGIHGECSRNKLEALAKALEWVKGGGR